MKLVVISPPDAPSMRLLDPLKSSHQVAITDDPEELQRSVPDAKVIVTSIGNGAVLQRLWTDAGQLEWIHSLTAGVENLIFPELRDSPIPLTNSRGVYKESLGEFVAAAALFFAKDFPRMLRNQRAGRWEQFDVDVVYHQTMGIVGYGEIGRAAAQRAKALGMKVFTTRRRPELSAGDPLIDRAFPVDSLLEMIAASDYVVVSAPLTPETRGLIGEREIAAMKPTAVIMNVGRGPVIDEAALVSALEQRRIRGAALDVFDVEPLPEGHPFWTLENVLLSPHCADHIEGWMESTVEFFLKNFSRYVAGEPLLNVVDKRAGY